MNKAYDHYNEKHRGNKRETFAAKEYKAKYEKDLVR